MTDEKLIEAMARALARKRYGHCGGDEGKTLVHTLSNWKFCVPDAECALAAYRQCTGDDGK